MLADGRRFFGKRFHVQARPNGAAGARLGIIAGRKTVARAVDRNRSKRLIREMFRSVRGALGSVDVIVLCRQPIPRGENAAARSELERLFADLTGDGHLLGQVTRRQELNR